MSLAPLCARAATIIKPPELKFSGYSQFGYTRDNSTTVAGTDYAFEDSYRLLKARLTFKADIDPRVALNVQFDAAARDTAGNAKNILTDAYFDFKYLKGHTIRAGQFRLPFGLENPISDAKVFPISASILTTKSVNTRDVGVDIFAKRDKYEYHAAMINGTGSNKSDDNSKKDFIVSAQGNVVSRVKVGASVLTGAGSPGQTTMRHAVDGFVLWTPPMGDVSFEYVKGRDKTAMKADGWYFMVTPKINDRTWIVARYDNFDPNSAAGDDLITRTTLGLLYKTSKYSLVKLNYEWRNDEAKTNEGNAFKFVWQVEY
jgi:hypothetical protein